MRRNGRQKKNSVTLEHIVYDFRVFNMLKGSGIDDIDELINVAEDGRLFKIISNLTYKLLKKSAAEFGVILPDKSGDDGADEPSGDDDEEE